MNTPTLETDRLILRKFKPWFPLQNLGETQNFFEERFAAKYAQPQTYAYAICHKNDHDPIGYIHVDMEEHHESATLCAGNIGIKELQARQAGL